MDTNKIKYQAPLLDNENSASAGHPPLPSEACYEIQSCVFVWPVSVVFLLYPNSEISPSIAKTMGFVNGLQNVVGFGNLISKINHGAFDKLYA
jgi:hypothetical protein